MKSPIFTYGSLMFPQIWRRVVSGTYRSAPATVNGHARFAVAGQTYPGMVALPGAAVRGLVYFDVDQADIALLDLFEGEAYRREILDAVLENGDVVAAGAYIHIDKSVLSDAPWDRGRFEIDRFIESHFGP
ncbi:MAG: gamma-glutamylcyclotransferase [Burkholderiales bacterium RIFCSPLOWO2_02_FULL_57_36]|nr:MAG: gamma-glutamylcyclotransferase [Burkholderiales bacterium RIFCSPLOWO2_02_FULL_57_36]